MAGEPISMKEVQDRVIEKAWRDETYAQELRSDPKAVIQREIQQLDAQITVPDWINFEILEDTPNTVHMVLPAHWEAVDSFELSEEQLDLVAGGGYCSVINTSSVNFTSKNSCGC